MLCAMTLPLAVVACTSTQPVPLSCVKPPPPPAWIMQPVPD
ncbi:lysis system o-spanin lipoprotein Rz1, partial [Salmonella enterica]